MEKTRTAEILKDGKWTPTEWRNIKAGDEFRLFEPDGTPVRDSRDGRTSWIAEGTAIPIPKSNGVSSSDLTNMMITVSTLTMDTII